MSNPPGPTIRETWTEAWALLRRCLGACLIYGVVFEIAAAVLLGPFIVWLTDRALALGGTPVATNVDIVGAVFSVAGVASILIGSLGTAVLLVLGVGGQVVLTAAAQEGRAPRLRVVLREVLVALPRLLRPSLWRVALLVAAIAPVLGIAFAVLHAVTLGSSDSFLLQVVPKSTAGAAVFIAGVLVLAAICYVAIVRWTFLLHAFLLEQRGLSDSYQRSATLVAQDRKWVLRSVLAFHAMVIVVPIAAAAVYALLIRLLLKSAVVDAGSGGFLAISMLLFLAATTVSLVGVAFLSGFGSAIGTVLFRRAGGKIGRVAEDDLRAGLWSGRKALGAVALLFVVGGAFTAPRIIDIIRQETDLVQVTAHRGSSAVAPENSMAAFRLAIEEGADFIELDVLETKDRGLIVVHDPNLKRLTGVDKGVYELTVAEIQQLDSGSHFDPKFADERMPTLKEVIDLVRGKIRLNIEIKIHGKEQDFPDSVVRLIHAEDFRDLCVVTSLDGAALKRVRELDPEIRIGAIVTAAFGNVHALDVDFYSVEQQKATVPFIRQSHALGREVHVWTVNEPTTISLFMDRGADNLITDYPARAIGLRDARDADDQLRATMVRIFER